MMLKENDKNKLVKILKEQNLSLLEIREYLIYLKSKNISQDELYSFLENLRSSSKTESEEDFILDVMDLVCGWCSSDLKIYP